MVKPTDVGQEPVPALHSVKYTIGDVTIQILPDWKLDTDYNHVRMEEMFVLRLNPERLPA